MKRFQRNLPIQRSREEALLRDIIEGLQRDAPDVDAFGESRCSSMPSLTRLVGDLQPVRNEPAPVRVLPPR